MLCYGFFFSGLVNVSDRAGRTTARHVRTQHERVQQASSIGHGMIPRLDDWCKLFNGVHAAIRSLAGRANTSTSSCTPSPCCSSSRLALQFSTRLCSTPAASRLGAFVAPPRPRPRLSRPSSSSESDPLTSARVREGRHLVGRHVRPTRVREGRRLVGRCVRPTPCSRWWSRRMLSVSKRNGFGACCRRQCNS
jgi:hypothetical protein